MAASASVQIPAAVRRNPVQNVLVWLLSLSAGPSGNSAVSDRDPGPSGREKTADSSPVATRCRLCLFSVAGDDKRYSSAGISLYTGRELGLGLRLRPGILDRDRRLPPVPGIRPLEPAPQRKQESLSERARSPTAVLHRLAGLPCRLYQAGSAGVGERSHGQCLPPFRLIF